MFEIIVVWQKLWVRTKNGSGSCLEMKRWCPGDLSKIVENAREFTRDCTFSKKGDCPMLEALQTIREGIPGLFPDAMGFPIEPETPLNHIPEWDSMSSVNFKVFLEETFGVKIPDDLLEGGSTISEVINFIRRAN
jgi:acyl carrier protein